MENENQNDRQPKAVGLETGVIFCPDTAEEIIQWHKDKFGETWKSDKWAVYRKLLEEVGELGEAMARSIEIFKEEDVKLEFGDVGICLIVLADKLNISRDDVIKSAHLKNLSKGKI